MGFRNTSVRILAVVLESGACSGGPSVVYKLQSPSLLFRLLGLGFRVYSGFRV